MVQPWPFPLSLELPFFTQILSSITDCKNASKSKKKSGPTRPPDVFETPISYQPAYFLYPKNDKCKYLNLQSPVSAQNPASEEGRPQRKSETNKADSEGDKSDDKAWVDKKKLF